MPSLAPEDDEDDDDGDDVQRSAHSIPVIFPPNIVLSLFRTDMLVKH